MSADKLCRVCLADNMNLYYVRRDLQNVYERIAREKYNEVGYPVHMCYICLTVLRKCHRFMETARDTNNVLKQWHYQQNEMKVASPLYTYSISKAELVSMYDENKSKENDIKVEKVDSEQEDVQPEYRECNTDVDIDKTDIAEQTDYSELLVHSPNDSDNDNIEDENDGQTDLVLNNEIDVKAISSFDANLDDNTNIKTTIKTIPQYDVDDDLPSIKKHETNENRPQHQAPGTSGEPAVDSETSNDITPLNSTLSHSDNIRDINTKTKQTANEYTRSSKQTSKLGKVLKTNVIQKKIINQRFVKYTLKNINKSTLSGNASKKDMDKNKYCEVRNFKCITKEVLPKHMRLLDDSRLHVCDMCDSKFSFSSSLSRHKSMKHKMSTPEEYICDTCNYKTKIKFHLIRHIRTHTGETPFSCDNCEYKCKQKVHLESHMRSHTGDKSAIQDKPFACHICKSKFTTKQYLKIHMRTHTGTFFSCHICEYKCTQKGTLGRHLRTHTGEKPFACNICDYKCAHKGNLVLHMRTHTGERPFSCDVCEYKFKHRSALNKHILTHTGENPYSCKICDYKCKQKCLLKRHIMMIHTGEKPFACNICEYKSICKNNLKVHMRTHTGEKPFSCEKCDYKCSDKSSLTSHMKYHTGERPFLCHVCSHRFVKNRDLRNHITTHTGEKPYSCNSCDYKSTRKRHLDNHVMKKHTAENLVATRRRGRPRGTSRRSKQFAV